LLHFADTIPVLSLAISLLPKEFSSISNPIPTLDCISAAAVALAVMINSLATHTHIGPIIVLTADNKVVISSICAMELSYGSHKCKIQLPSQLSKQNILLVPKAAVKHSGCTSSIEIYMAKKHHHS
jgi:hypothetical protein